MQTLVSHDGQIVLPEPVRRRLDIRPGDQLDVEDDGQRIVLMPHKERTRVPARIEIEPRTGLPVLVPGRPDAPILTSREVDEALADFP